MKKTIYQTSFIMLSMFLLTGCNDGPKETVFEMPTPTETSQEIPQQNIASQREIDTDQISQQLNNAAANEFFKQGIEAANNQQFEDALALFDQAIELVDGMNKMKVLSNKASMLYNLERYEEALPLYDEVIAIDPDFFEHYSNKGATLLKMGRYQEAVDLYLMSLEKEPNNFPALYNMACAYALKGDPNKAIDYLGQALAIRPEAKDFATEDTDLESLWNRPEFQELIANTVVPEKPQGE